MRWKAKDLFENCTLVGEFHEPIMSVAFPDTAIVYSSERQIWIVEMHSQMIYSCITRTGLGEKLASDLGIRTKDTHT